MKAACLPALAVAILIQPMAYADVTYQETTTITGGSLTSMLKLAGAFSSQARQMNQAVVTTISLHGNRMIRSNAHTTEIIDLDQRAMTFIDHDKHNYYVVTFQEMEQAMANAAAQAKRQGAAPATQQGNQMTFSGHISSNGATRTIDGLQAKEELVTVTMLANANDGSNVQAGMAATSEMWLVPEVPGMDELRSFNQRMAQELSVDTSASQISGLLATQPGGTEALANIKKEASKMKGVPVLQITRVGISTDGSPLPAPSVAPVASNQGSGSGAGKVAGDIATDTTTQAAGSEMSKLGTFGRALGSSTLGAFTRHKAQPKPQPASTPGSPDAAGVLLESQTSMDHFSTSPATIAMFDVPTGYKQVKSPLLKAEK